MRPERFLLRLLGHSGLPFEHEQFGELDTQRGCDRVQVFQRRISLSTFDAG
jgi:hypothetical protein